MRHSQRGMSTYTLIVFVLMLIFSGLFAFKVGMPILDNWTVQEVLQSISKDDQAKDMSSEEIRKWLDKKFQVNRIEHINVKDDIRIYTEKGVRKVTADYEARVPFFSNIDLVVKFDANTVTLGGRSE